jgi:hypothetical protein
MAYGTAIAQKQVPGGEEIRHITIPFAFCYVSKAGTGSFFYMRVLYLLIFAAS